MVKFLLSVSLVILLTCCLTGCMPQAKSVIDRLVGVDTKVDSTKVQVDQNKQQTVTNDPWTMRLMVIASVGIVYVLTRRRIPKLSNLIEGRKKT